MKSRVSDLIYKNNSDDKQEQTEIINHTEEGPSEPSELSSVRHEDEPSFEITASPSKAAVDDDDDDDDKKESHHPDNSFVDENDQPQQQQV